MPIKPRVIRHSLTSAVLAAGTCGVLALPVYAADDNPAPTPKTTVKDLQNAGYTCERAGIDVIICSKPGRGDWYCRSSAECVESKVNPPWKKPHHAPTPPRLIAPR